MSKRLKPINDTVYACITNNGITYKAYYTNDTKYFGGFAWLIETSKGGQRIYPSTMSCEQAIREWIEGKEPRKKVMY